MGGASMTTPGRRSRPVTDLAVSVMFCTRLPLAHANPVSSGDIARASWAMPVAGTMVGAFGALVYWAAVRLGLPPLVAAALAVAAGMGATGCLHEDGLADAADGLGGGDRERRLEIMRDSRLGTYGACALMMSLLLRWGALASIAGAGAVAFALVAAHTAARAPLPAFMAFVPAARRDGLAAAAGVPPFAVVVTAGLIGALALVLCLGPLAALVALVLLAAAGMLAARVSVAAIGGHTGDVLGALEQVNEVLILLVATIFLKPGASA
jgi:adenosylcobinamide-GDP ribazoletransferase